MWTTEAELVAQYEQTLPSLWRFTDSRAFVVREFRTGFGIPDVLVAYALPSVIDARREELSRQPQPLQPLSRLAAYVMTYLQRRRWTALTTITSFLGRSSSTTRQIVQELTARDLVLQRDECVRAYPLGTRMALQGLVAIEAKLSDWQRAAEQAHRHLWFTPQSYVLLAPATARTVERAAGRCEALNVGLLVANTEGHAKAVIRPKRSPMRAAHITWQLNELLVDKARQVVV